MHSGPNEKADQNAGPDISASTITKQEGNYVPSFRMRGNGLKSSKGNTVGFFDFPTKKYAPMSSARIDTAPATNKLGSSIMVIVLFVGLVLLLLILCLLATGARLPMLVKACVELW